MAVQFPEVDVGAGDTVQNFCLNISTSSKTHLERRGSLVVSTSACHAAGRGSIPGPVALLG